MQRVFHLLLICALSAISILSPIEVYSKGLPEDFCHEAIVRANFKNLRTIMNREDLLRMAEKFASQTQLDNMSNVQRAGELVILLRSETPFLVYVADEKEVASQMKTALRKAKFEKVPLESRITRKFSDLLLGLTLPWAIGIHTNPSTAIATVGASTAGLSSLYPMAHFQAQRTRLVRWISGSAFALSGVALLYQGFQGGNFEYTKSGALLCAAACSRALGGDQIPLVEPALLAAAGLSWMQSTTPDDLLGVPLFVSSLFGGFADLLRIRHYADTIFPYPKDYSYDELDAFIREWEQGATFFFAGTLNGNPKNLEPLAKKLGLTITPNPESGEKNPIKLRFYQIWAHDDSGKPALYLFVTP